MSGAPLRCSPPGFTTPNGQPLAPTNLTRRFCRLLHSAGLRTIHFHDLGHSTATWNKASISSSPRNSSATRSPVL